MPTNTGAVEEIRFHRVVAEAERYEWTSAAKACEEMLAQNGSKHDPETVVRLTELSAKCNFKSAFQSRTRALFKGRMGLAKVRYGSAASLYEKIGDEGVAKMAKARELFTDFWLDEDSETRRVVIEKCVELSQEAATFFGNHGDKRHLAEAHVSILNYYLESLHLLINGESLVRRLNEAVNLGRNTVLEWEALGGGEELVETLQLTLWMLTVLAQVLLEPQEFERLREETLSLGSKLSHLSKRLGTPYSEYVSREISGNVAFSQIGDPVKALGLYREGISAARSTRDSLVIGRLLTFVGLAERSRSFGEEYAEDRRVALENALKMGEEARENLVVPFHTSYLAAACDVIANSHIDLATHVETKAEEKRLQLKQAIEASRNALSYETDTWGWQRVAHAFSKAAYFLATLEPDAKQRKTLLNDALGIRERILRVTDQLSPSSWSGGVMRNYLALVKSEIASLETDTGVRMGVLEGAVSDMRECLSLCGRWAKFPGFAQHLANYSEWYGDILLQMYGLKPQAETAQSAADAFLEAIQYTNRSGLVASIPVIRWKLAKVYDAVEDFKKASECFGKAVEEFRAGAIKIHGLKSTFEELAVYMEGWIEIESARLSHIQEEFASACEGYSRAAKHLQETKNWNYLSRLLAARSLLEKGESLSAEEKHTGAIGVFKNATEGFREARNVLEEELRKSHEVRERAELGSWLEIARQREPYCQGRLELEEARVLDKRGEKSTSVRKYRSASETFRTLLRVIDNPPDRSELDTLAEFCEAWAWMKEAESKAAPELFAKAAESFTRVKETTTRQTFRLLALADASICKALESGTRFRITRNAQLYPEIKRHLETAADYFVEAGFNKTGIWTRATQRLFDSLVYLSDAEAERDPKRKTELFRLAEKHLELAAKLYGAAGFPSKRREALQHLGRAREEKELLLTSMKALSEIPVASSSSVMSISPGQGQPLGLERFEEANIVGHLTVPERELKAGSDFAFEIEMANAGRATATLVRLENVVPEGFEIEREKNPYRIEDHSIDLKGRRLEHLKMDEMKIVLRPVQKGTFQLRPRAVFADDRGNYRKLEFEPVEIRVGELGFSGWLRGPGKSVQPREKPLEMVATSQASLTSRFEGIPPIVRVPPEFKFETERAREVFHALVKAFVSDYVVKRLYVEKAGWRSLMDLVREMKIPRSAVYAPGGRDGPVLEELEQRGLVEARIFPKERGRGGDIKKVRVAYDNEIVKRIVEQTVIEDK